jgi:hypothetical protein
MENMWRLVVATAKRLDVQVFATTHSLDCVRALAWIRTKLGPDQSQVTLHRLERDLDRPVSYSMDEIELAARTHAEVR